MESQAVSSTFIDEVTSTTKTVEGDPGRLLEALENGAVKRFRSESVARLRQFLEDAGYLATQPPLSLDEVRARTVAAVAGELQRGELDADAIDWLLGRVGS